MYKIFAISVLLILGACAAKNPMPDTTQAFKEESKEKSRPFRARVADFVYPETTHQYIIDPVPIVTTKPFCYKTWDKPVCYSNPQPGEESRLVGYEHIN